MFEFAKPPQILTAVAVYAADFYGSNLWNLFGEGAGQAFRTWNTCVKLAWEVPRWTHNYFVDNLLSGDIPSLRKKLICQYVKFFQDLRTCPLREIRILVGIAARDCSSVTGINLEKIEEEFYLDPWSNPSSRFKVNYEGYTIPEQDVWRISYLQKLLLQRMEMVTCDEDVGLITELIDSLSST